MNQPESIRVPSKGKIVKRTAMGTIFLRKNSSRLYVRVGRRTFPTRLKFSKENISLAKELMEEKWRRTMGVFKHVEQEPVTIQQAFKEYFQLRSKTKAPSTLTLDKYAFREVVGDRDYDVNPADIVDDIQQFLGRENLSQQTKQILLKQFFVLLNFMHGKPNPYLSQVPRRCDYMPKVTPKKIEIFSGLEITAILNHLRGTGSASDNELSLLIEFLLGLGCRIHEALELRHNQLTSTSILFKSKDGNKIEEVPITKKIRIVLDQLPKNRIKVFRWQLSTVGRLRRRLAEVMDELGIERRGRSFHCFRKTRWSELVAKKVDFGIASRLMRSSIVTASRHYISYSVESLRESAEL